VSYAQTSRQADKQTNPLEHENISKSRISKGFTLAEVLLVITIIGVIASLTIPDLITNIIDQQYAAKLKKTFSVLSNATIQVKEDNGGTLVGLPVIGWSNYSLISYYYTYLNIIKQCTHPNTKGNCWHKDYEYYLYDGTPTTTPISPIGVILADGAFVIFRDVSTTCTNGNMQSSTCDFVEVDVNGFKSPNTYGKDIFSFFILKDRIVPRGMQGDYMPECTDGTDNWCPAHILLNN